MTDEDSLSLRPPTALVLYGLIPLLLIGTADYLTGYDFGLDLFYLVPIAFESWYLGTAAGVLFSVVTIIVMTFSDILSGKEYTRLALEIWNGSIRLGFYLVVAVLLSRLRSTIRELRKSLKEVKELRGILPICSSCKKIRTDEGYWQNVEEYIRRHTNAEFSHGICQECAVKLYPEYYANKEKELNKR